MVETNDSWIVERTGIRERHIADPDVAFLVEPTDDPGIGFLDYINEIDGSGGQFLHMPGGGSRMPATAETVAKRMHYVKQEGQQVFKYAVRKMYELSDSILRRNGLSAADISLMIPHQANQRIITATAERLGIPSDRVVVNLSKVGNTTAATIPLATAEALGEGRLRRGDLVLFSAVGAGYTAGVSLWRWAY